MQNGSPNGPSPQDERVTPAPVSPRLEVSILQLPSDSGLYESIPSVPKDEPNDGQTDTPNEEQASHDLDVPPSKKRRLTDTTPSRRSTPRVPSPPWKKPGIEGPTSFMVEGRRRSGRQNLLPLEMQPQSDKRHTRAAHQTYATKNTRGAKSAMSSPLAVTQSRADVNGKLGGKAAVNGSPRTSSTKGVASKQQKVSQSPAPKPQHSRAASRSSGISHRPRPSLNGTSPRQLRDRTSLSNISPTAAGGLDESDMNIEDAEGSQVVPRIRIKVKKPILPIRHPGHITGKKYESFREWVDREDALNLLSPEEALEEAQRRREVLNAVEPGGPLSEEVCSAYITDQQEEPPPQFSHQDHLVNHALYFQKLLEKEHKRHRQTAKLFAQWCADAYRKRHKNPEDILREQQEEVRGKRKQLAKDLQKSTLR